MRVLSNLSLLIIVVSITACKSASSGDSSQANSISSVEQPATTPTPEPSPTPAPQPVTCKDASGVVHEDGAAWQMLGDVSTYVCPASDQVAYQEVIMFTCVKGDAIQTGNQHLPATDSNPCNLPSLSASISPATALIGAQVAITYTSQYLSSMQYSCANAVSGAVVQTGSLSTAHGSIGISINDDLNCVLKGTAETGRVFSVSVSADVQCGNKIKVNGHCEDFACKKLVEIAPDSSGVLAPPARTAEGICYAYKLMDRIANSSSSLTTAISSDVISRNHDGGYSDANNVHNPYLMGQAKLVINLQGARTLKLAGSGDSLASILIDNFVLVGINVHGVAATAADYRAYGTSDSTVGTTGGVLLNNVVVPLTPFASGGTSTIAPLNITDLVKVKQLTDIDIRALDAGGSRELSDIFVVFQ